MRVISAYLLAVLGGNASPSAADIKKILSSVGVEAEDARITQLLGELSGKDLNEVIAAGKKQLAAVPSGPAGGAAPAAASAAPAAAAAKKEEKKEESEEEDMGFSLFD